MGWIRTKEETEGDRAFRVRVTDGFIHRIEEVWRDCRFESKAIFDCRHVKVSATNLIQNVHQVGVKSWGLRVR